MVPHTADVALEAWAPTMHECVAQAVHALVGSFVELHDGVDGGAPGRESVAIDREPAADPDDLLVSVLDEAIYQVEVHGRVPVGVSFDERAGVRFETVPLDDVRIVGAIPKAVSLHELRFGRSGDLWRCHVTVDV
ncbi:MAG TPA: archease [Streptosporangiaceae bacterium]|nr:archease [Streptosporangiaceae bacterium]